MSVYEIGLQPHLREPRRGSRTDLNRQVAEFEVEHRMSTAEFVAQWRAGEIPENPAFREWYRLSSILAQLG